MIDVKHLRVLLAVHEHGTLSAAAKALGYSQPAVTQQLRALEAEVKTPVLIRNRNGATLTDAGRILIRHGRTMLDAAALAAIEVSAVAGLKSGTVRLAAFAGGAAAIVPSAIARVRRAHPGLRFTLVEAQPPEAMALVRRGECDVAVTYRYSTSRPTMATDIERYALFDEVVHIVMAESDPLARRDDVAVADLADADWISGSLRGQENLSEVCAAAGFTPRVAYQTDDYVALQRLAARGLGVALVPDLVLSLVATDGLAVRRLEPLNVRAVSAVSPRGLAQVPAVRATLMALHAASADLIRQAQERTPSLSILAPDLTRRRLTPETDDA